MFKLKTLTQDWFGSKEPEYDVPAPSVPINIGKEVPKMRITYESIIDAIKQVEANELMGSGRYTKRDHLADRLFAMFTVANKNKPVTIKPLLTGIAAPTPVPTQAQTQPRRLMQLTFDRVLETITMVENNELMGAGKLNKQEHLAETLFALFNLASSEEPNAVTLPSALGPKNASLTNTRAQPRQAQQAPSQQGPMIDDATSFA